MASINVPVNQFPGRTHEGGLSRSKSPEAELRRSVMACMLWEGEFYEDGKTLVQRICELVPQVEPRKVAEIAIQAREVSYLRHVPLLLVRELVRTKEGRSLVAGTLSRVIQRPDELTEFLAIYWKDKKQPLAASVKKGLAAAFGKFSAYQLAKYDNWEKPIKLRDVLFLCHARPKDIEQVETWHKLVNKTLEPPNTWEVRLSASQGEGKRAIWEELLKENALGSFALIRNLRNMVEQKVDDRLVREALSKASPDKILPFRFLAALKAAPSYTGELEGMMLKNLEGQQKLKGRTILLVDVSGSMDVPISAKSDLHRVDAGAGLSILVREICESARVVSFSDYPKEVPAYRGLGLVDAIKRSQPHSGTDTIKAVDWANTQEYDRLIIITDEQANAGSMGWGGRRGVVPGPKKLGYIVNVASYQNGIGYGPWVQIDGWSERVIDFIREYERNDNE